MQTEQGKRYVVTLQVNGLLAGTDWVAVPFAQKFPVAILRQSSPRVAGEAVRSDLVVQWQGKPGQISIGDLVEGMSMPDLPPVRATVIGVAEATSTLDDGESSAALGVMGAVTILLFVAYASSRIGGSRGSV
jgi:hypothetical protein